MHFSTGEGLHRQCNINTTKDTKHPAYLGAKLRPRVFAAWRFVY
jgi:hypothetical protein